MSPIIFSHIRYNAVTIKDVIIFAERVVLHVRLDEKLLKKEESVPEAPQTDHSPVIDKYEPLQKKK
ncbi:hypothetical protein GCM10020331_031150 [Ectobacillus funiculus]